MTPVVALDRLPVERAVCVLVDGEQIALVRTRDDVVHAVDNLDPISGAMVMSRGIVGSRGDRDVLVSPMHKQAYDLVSGECLDHADTWLRVHPVQVREGTVEVQLAEDVRLPA
jgi:nitrite reductase (NADH) small subunit